MRLEGITVTPELERYMESLLPARDPVLAEIERQVSDSDIPGVGPAVGQLLYLLLRTGGVVDALELGTAVGYSTIWLARGCRGRLTTLEVNPERARRARENLSRAGLADRTQVVEEDALAYLERSEDTFDCIFNDLLNSFPDEHTTGRCFELCLRRLRPGGLLLADNALRRGEVVAPGSRPARNVVLWNRLVAESPRLESVVVPLRDGVSIARLRD